MARPHGPIATAAWRDFVDARDAHYKHGAPRQVLSDAANRLNDWTEQHGDAPFVDLGHPDLDDLEALEPLDELGEW